MLGNIFVLHRLITKNEKALNQLNCKHENIIIIATKLDPLNKINCSKYCDVNINQQDELGYTALYYAIYVKDKYDIKFIILVWCKNNSSSKGFSLFKKKDTDEYIDNYITNYQVDKFRNDYEYIIKNVHYSYTNRNNIDGILGKVGKSYDMNIKSKGKLQNAKYIRLNRCDPEINANDYYNYKFYVL
ncbi:hypothetical protein H8356DRAFT_1314048 [Neocallimastix lanati (nom. inval.)]|nr:hypothetical protein H8356DRAFT_1314048 [Neocallimastix sp. JGI-2020a]